MEWEIFGLVFTGIAAILVSIVLYFVIQAVFLWIGAKLARVEKASFGRAFTAAIGITIMIFIVGVVLAALSVGGVIAGAVGLLATIWVIKSVFDTGWIQAAVAWFLSIVGAVVAVLLISALVIGTAIL